mgnify:CR=1 FL=1
MSEMSQQQRVFITAAAQGIGRAIARGFIAAGARVHICDIDQDALNAMAEESDQISCSLTDVGSEAQVEAFFREGLEQLGGIDVLVNNAGIGGPAGVLESLDSDVWQQTVQINLNATFYACKQALPLMKQQQSGAIINLSSTAGIMGYPLRTPYAAAKWAVTGLTKSLAMECGGDNIRVNAICPGAVSGERMDRVIANEAQARNCSEADVRTAYVSQCSMQTFVDPEDIADMAVFLASEGGKRVSGQVISVDGDTHTLA